MMENSPVLTETSVPSFSGLMEIRSVSVGVVAIKSVSTGLYLAMSKKGTLFGSVGTPATLFHETPWAARFQLGDIDVSSKHRSFHSNESLRSTLGKSTAGQSFKYEVLIVAISIMTIYLGPA